ncbi:hypothetical protein EYF80_033174 [Liparis tanakae]|uniref:Uncharacterized protein n=1 Tax=Liparis tanakae TaxID=230148 RepID=A0A4Z2GSR0_9TELE|nr:hypothetical protein EYF80_033174 [Liparis tanakae]
MMPSYITMFQSSPVRICTHAQHDVKSTVTWKQVSSAWGKASKVLRLVCVSSKLNFPPNSCMPSRAKMMRKRKSSSSSDAMDFMEFSSDATSSGGRPGSSAAASGWGDTRESGQGGSSVPHSVRAVNSPAADLHHLGAERRHRTLFHWQED